MREQLRKWRHHQNHHETCWDYERKERRKEKKEKKEDRNGKMMSTRNEDTENTTFRMEETGRKWKEGFVGG